MRTVAQFRFQFFGQASGRRDRSDSTEHLVGVGAPCLQHGTLARQFHLGNMRVLPSLLRSQLMTGPVRTTTTDNDLGKNNPMVSNDEANC